MIYTVHSNPASIMAFTVGIIALLILLLFITVMVIFIYQLSRALNEDFKNKTRNYVLTFLGIVILGFMYLAANSGIQMYRAKHHLGQALVAVNTQDLSHVQSIVYMKNGKFAYVQIDEPMKQLRGRYTMRNDTIFMHDLKKKKNIDQFYTFGIVEGDPNTPDNQLLLYTNNQDTIPLKMSINFIEPSRLKE